MLYFDQFGKFQADEKENENFCYLSVKKRSINQSGRIIIYGKGHLQVTQGRYHRNANEKFSLKSYLYTLFGVKE